LRSECFVGNNSSSMEAPSITPDWPFAEANALATKNFGLAVCIAKHRHNRHPERGSFDEFLSWAMTGLMKASRRFDPSRGYKFSTFASHKIEFEILSGIRGRAKEMENLESFEIAIENGLNPVAADCYEPLVISSERIVAEALRKALTTLSPIERDVVISCDIEGQEQYEVSARYDRSPSWASYKRRSALKKLREILEPLGGNDDE
jgi:RNA polymerase sigma factor (sigma-70 family)